MELGFDFVVVWKFYGFVTLVLFVKFSKLILLLPISNFSGSIKAVSFEWCKMKLDI